MKSLNAETLTKAELVQLASRIKTEHLRDIFETVILGDERDPNYDVFVSSGDASLGVTGSTRLSNSDEDGFVLLFVDGNLTVQGSLTIEDDPPTFLIVTGDLIVEGSLVAAGWVEVQGTTKIGGALAGDYNHGEAHFLGDTSAAVFIRGDYEFSFGGHQAFGKTVDAGTIVDAIRAGKPWTVPKGTKPKKKRRGSLD